MKYIIHHLLYTTHTFSVYCIPLDARLVYSRTYPCKLLHNLGLAYCHGKVPSISNMLMDNTCNMTEALTSNCSDGSARLTKCGLYMAFSPSFLFHILPFRKRMGPDVFSSMRYLHISQVFEASKI